MMSRSPPIVRIIPDGKNRALFSLALQFAIAADQCDGEEIPVMDLRGNENGYFDPDHPNPNPWEYYFVQPQIENVVRTDDSSWGYPCFMSEFDRAQAHRNLRKHLKVQEHISAKVDQFRREHLDGHRVLGIHVRGTDSYLDNSRPHLPTEFIVRKILLYMEALNFDKILLCTDQVQTVERFRKIFGDRLACYPSDRIDLYADPITGIHTPECEIPPYKKGEDVLVEALLLSHSSFLLKTYSNLTHFAIAWNDELDYVDLDYRFFDLDVFWGKVHEGWNLPGKPCQLEGAEAEEAYIRKAIEFAALVGPEGTGATPELLAEY